MTDSLPSVNGVATGDSAGLFEVRPADRPFSGMEETLSSSIDTDLRVHQAQPLRIFNDRHLNLLVNAAS